MKYGVESTGLACGDLKVNRQVNRPNSTEPQRDTVGNEIQRLADEIAIYANDTENKTRSILNPIMNEGAACKEPDCAKISKPYPPLFDVLRGSLETIRSALNGINNSLSRTEL